MQTESAERGMYLQTDSKECICFFVYRCIFFFIQADSKEWRVDLAHIQTESAECEAARKHNSSQSRAQRGRGTVQTAGAMCVVVYIYNIHTYVCIIFIYTYSHYSYIHIYNIYTYIQYSYTYTKYSHVYNSQIYIYIHQCWQDLMNELARKCNERVRRYL